MRTALRLRPRCARPTLGASGAAALGLAALALSPFALAEDAKVPEHPREIRVPELAFEPPLAAKHRLELENGLVAYLVPDATLPVLRVRAHVRTGAIYDPNGKEGLASLVFSTLRSAGAGELDGDELDDRLDKVAATIDGEASDTRGTVDLWTHARHAETVLGIFASVLRSPRFEQERISRVRDDAADEAKTDEDDSRVIAPRRVKVAVYGTHPIARFRSEASLRSIERDDLVAFHKRFFTPGRVVLAVSGAFDEKAMRAKIEALFGDWEKGGEGWQPVPPVAPPPNLVMKPPLDKRRLRFVERPETGLGYVELGRLGFRSGSEEEPALILADHIFGSGSFTSRISARVRGEEGLAYSVGSDFDTTPLVPGTIRIDFQSRAAETSYALSLVVEEARKLARDGPSPEELEGAKSAVLGRFPGRFATATDAARALAEARIEGLPEDWYGKFRSRISEVTAEQVRAAAAHAYDPDALAITVVGPPAARRSLAHGTSLDDLGTVTVEKPPP